MSNQLENSIKQIETGLIFSEQKRNMLKQSIIKYITQLEVKIKEEK